MIDVSYYSIVNVQDFAFNSINGDKKYNADDLCEWLSTTNSDGVVSTSSAYPLKVERSSATTLLLRTGKGLISGHSMKVINDITIDIETKPASTDISRIDIVGFRLNTITRQVEPF